MEKSLEALHKELGGIRTGRATPSLIDRVQVDYYGAPTPLQTIAGITAPEARLLLIQPYDRSSIQAIEKALQKSELGLNPSNDGQVIRIAIPPLTEERRREFAKLVKQKAEEARISVRNIRRDEVDHLRKLEKDGHVSKDEIERNITEVQRITDSFVGRVDDLTQKKEADILEV
ncbi:MAG: ribosome recycling factor [Candidatus Dormibacteraeota bacterium]|uniref:Ribosome-recycling factor n=1 Tax=Candidatus Amunia macphersoniae TaxID=3127014 RepID=A0A934NGN6_9BACT|nr:ribosome recycling factor [Candidatus Dormibacteraeota bacterium]